VPTKNQNQHESLPEDLMTTEKLVLHYLIRNSHLEVAQKFAMKTSLKMDQEIDKDMATVYEDFKDFLREMSTTKFENTTDRLLTDRLNNLSTPSQFKDTDELKFSRSNTKGGGVILNHKEFQYSKSGAKMGNGTTYWQCRFQRKLKCCRYLHLKDGKVKKNLGNITTRSRSEKWKYQQWEHLTQLLDTQRPERREKCFIFVDMNIL